MPLVAPEYHTKKFGIARLKASPSAGPSGLGGFSSPALPSAEPTAPQGVFSPAAPPSPLSGGGFNPDALGMKFASISPGTFTMGDSSNGPPHQVTLTRGFSIQTTEVTQAQWQAVMGSNPSNFKGDNLPVETVSWTDVQTFIEKLNSKGQGTYRLPTEAEWEYAARAGSTTAYACGDSESCLGNMAWYGSNSGNKTHPVGQKQPNAWGLYDMHGNVWEWVQDRYEPYSSGSVTDPMGSSSGSIRVNRGGSWFNDAFFCRSALRSSLDPSFRLNNLGFRLLRSAP